MSPRLRGMGGRGSPRRPGSAAGRAVPVRDRRLRGEVRRRVAPGDDPGRGRAVRDGHDVAHQRGDVRRRVLRRPRGRPRQRPRARRAARGVRRRCGLRVTTPGPRSTAGRATSTTPRPPPSDCATAVSNGLRSSTSTPTRATARRRSSGSAATCSTRASTSIRRPDGSRTSSDTPTSAVAAMVWGRPSTSRSRRDRATSRGSPRSGVCATPSRQHGPDAVVVSLGVDAAVDDPAAPLMVTADGFAAAGTRARRARRPDRVRAGGRLRPPPSRAARAGGARGLRGHCLNLSERSGGACVQAPPPTEGVARPPYGTHTDRRCRADDLRMTAR